MNSLRPYLGVEFETITPELAQAETLDVQEGAILRKVIPGSPADVAGLQAGDVVRKVNGERVDQQHTLRLRIAHFNAGDQVTLTITRGGEIQEVKVTLGAPPDGATFDIPFPLQDLQPGYRPQFYCAPRPGSRAPFRPDQPEVRSRD